MRGVCTGFGGATLYRTVILPKKSSAPSAPNSRTSTGRSSMLHVSSSSLMLISCAMAADPQHKISSPKIAWGRSISNIVLCAGETNLNPTSKNCNCKYHSPPHTHIRQSKALFLYARQHNVRDPIDHSLDLQLNARLWNWSARTCTSRACGGQRGIIALRLRRHNSPFFIGVSCGGVG